MRTCLRDEEDQLCHGYISILLLLFAIPSGALGSPDLILSSFITALALHDTIILIITTLTSLNP